MSMVDAALGCQIEVPTVYGNVDLKIPEGTQNGQILKLREKGYPVSEKVSTVEQGYNERKRLLEGSVNND